MSASSDQKDQAAHEGGNLGRAGNAKHLPLVGVIREDTDNLVFSSQNWTWSQNICYKYKKKKKETFH